MGRERKGEVAQGDRKEKEGRVWGAGEGLNESEDAQHAKLIWLRDASNCTCTFCELILPPLPFLRKPQEILFNR